MFVYEELREVPKWNNLSICLSQRIHSGLHMLDLGGIASWCPDLLLWVLLLGRSGANPLEMTGKSWFLKAIADLEAGFGVEVPEEVTAVVGLNYFELAEAMMAKWRPSGGETDDGDIRGEG
jgi:hypothetical protein